MPKISKNKRTNTISSNNMDSNNSIDKILTEISKKITPDESVVKDADLMVDRINSYLKKQKIDAKCVKGGSIAKGTFLKDDYDIDLFVRFDKSYEDKEISDILEQIISKVCKDIKSKFERIHGSRDYFQFKHTSIYNKKELSFEIVPVLMVHKSNEYEANNSTDLSPEHVEWVLNNVKKNPKLPNQIRITKRFLKSCKIYGAESYINGFSGHVVDIMIVHFKSFIDMIKYFSKFEANHDKPIIIDTDKRLINPLKQLNSSKITPLIIIDPIQSLRNSAAAVSRESLSKLIIKSKEFLDSPSIKFFELEKFDLKKEISKNTKKLLDSKKIKNVKDIKIIILNIETLNSSKDITGTKILKYYENLLYHLKLNDFRVYFSDWNFDYDNRFSQIYLFCEKKISSSNIQMGPPVANTSSNDKNKENYKKFIEKHKSLGNKILTESGRVKVVIKRKFTDPMQFIEDLNKKDFMNSKFKDIKEEEFK